MVLNQGEGYYQDRCSGTRQVLLECRRHHLDSLVGFSKENSQMIIVYDYLERKKGSPQKYLCWICDHFFTSYNKFQCI